MTWLTPKAVAGYVEVKGVTEHSVPLASAVSAVVAWVQGTARPDLPWSDPLYVVPADVHLGAIMLAWRWYQRRATPLGVVSAPSGEPLEILRNDPDIARLLGVSAGAGTGGVFIFGAGTIPLPGEYGYVEPVA